MKSLPQSNSTPSRARHDRRALALATSTAPRTDYHFQTATEDLVTTGRKLAVADAAELRAFRQISHDYLDEKNHRGYFVDILALLFVTGLSAWALVQLAIVLAQTARG